jgi:hypothetical protein
VPSGTEVTLFSSSESQVYVFAFLGAFVFTSIYGMAASKDGWDQQD